MVKRLLSSTTHYVLSVLIPISVALWYGVDIWTLCAAFFLSWYVCDTTECYVIRRYSPQPPEWFEAILTALLYAVCATLFYLAFFTTYASTGFKMLGLSLFVTSVLGFLYWLSVTIYIEEFNGYNTLYRRKVYRRNE